MVAVLKVALKEDTLWRFNKKINIISPSLIPMNIKNMMRGSSHSSNCRNSNITVKATHKTMKVK